MAKTSKAQQRRFLNTAGEHQQEILRLIRDAARTRGIGQVWNDWIEVSAIALARLDHAQFDAREKRYQDIISQYGQDNQQRLAQAFAHLVMEYDQRVAAGDFGDVLGSTFMMLDMGNASSGQFFTPYNVSRMMASMLMGDSRALADQVDARGFLRLMEPASGAGGMVIAAAHALHDAGINFQRAMHVTAIDIDQRCVHMTFLQLALLHIPAVVIHGNALSGEAWEHWFTPAHILGRWAGRLRRREADDAAAEQRAAPAAEPAPPELRPALPGPARKAAASGQMTLF